MCNCKKNKTIPQTPQQQHAQEMNEWNGGNIKIEQDEKLNNGEGSSEPIGTEKEGES